MFVNKISAQLLQGIKYSNQGKRLVKMPSMVEEVLDKNLEIRTGVDKLVREQRLGIQINSTYKGNSMFDVGFKLSKPNGQTHLSEKEHKFNTKMNIRERRSFIKKLLNNVIEEGNNFKENFNPEKAFKKLKKEFEKWKRNRGEDSSAVKIKPIIGKPSEQISEKSTNYTQTNLHNGTVIRRRSE